MARVGGWTMNAIFSASVTYTLTERGGSYITLLKTHKFSSDLEKMILYPDEAADVINRLQVALTHIERER